MSTINTAFAEMSLEDLAKSIRKGIASSRRNARKAIAFGRRSSVDLFDAGAALVAARANRGLLRRLA